VIFRIENNLYFVKLSILWAGFLSFTLELTCRQDARWQAAELKAVLVAYYQRRKVLGDRELYEKAVLNFVDIISVSVQLFIFMKQKKRKRAFSMLLFFVHVNSESLLVSRLWSSTM